MKKVLTLFIALLVSTITFAQQSLWGGGTLVSPEIHENNTVTFRLRAPKAVKVQVTGDFLSNPPGKPEGPAAADLKEGPEGVWEYTTPEPLAPELYNYSFIVDGLKMPDPSNIYLVRDVSSLMNMFIIGEDVRI